MHFKIYQNCSINILCFTTNESTTYYFGVVLPILIFPFRKGIPHLQCSLSVWEKCVEMEEFGDRDEEIEKFRKVVEFVEASCDEDSRIYQGQYFYYLLFVIFDIINKRFVEQSLLQISYHKVQN